MQLQRTFTGLEAHLRSTGFARFGGAAFLLVWLAGWAMGEAFALWFIIVGAKSLLTGEPPEPGRNPLVLAPTLAIGLFLLGWLVLWTIGGLAALYELMRLLWSRDHLCVKPDGLEITRRAGFLSRSRIIPRGQIRSLYRVDARSAVMAETLTSSIELTRLGRPFEQEELVRAFTKELDSPPHDILPPALPEEWREIPVPEGGTVMLKNPATRRKQAIVAWMVTLAVCAIAIVVIRAAFNDSALVAIAIIVGAIAAALTWGTLRLALSRTEWKLQAGRLIQQRRTGSRVRVLFEGQSLSVDSRTDSDGDTWYSANVIASTVPHATAREIRRSRRTLLQQMHDPTEPRRLAEWLAAKTGMPLTDTAGSTGATPDIATLTRQLEGAGTLGGWAARMIRGRTDKR